MSRWILVAEAAGEDEKPGWQLILDDTDGHGSAEAWIYSLKIAHRIKAALDWYDSFETGLVSLPHKPRTKAGTARPRPARTKRHPRAKGLK